MTENMYDLSIVIACYNGAHFIEKSVYSLAEILSKTKYNYELIFVDDCSKDNTKDVIKHLLEKYPNSKALYHKVNMGRGKTVEDGMKISKSNITGFIDIDLETPGYYIPVLVQELKNGYDICTAKRVYINPSLGSFHRWVAHKAYKFLVRRLLKTTLTDTETGCKFFVRDKIIPLFDEIKDKRWFWDTEIMVRGYYKGLKIKEIPTIFIREDSKGTTLKFFKDTRDYFRNLLRFRKEVKNIIKKKKSF